MKKSLITNKTTKIIFISALSLLAIAFLFILICNIIVITSADDYILSFEDAKAIQDADCIIILGAAVKPDGTMSNVLEERVCMGEKLYTAGVSNRILASGDHSRENYNEVGAMKEHLIDLGVPENVIFTDHAGFDTYDSMYRARDIFRAEKVVIVTQQFHISRSVYIARSLGLEAYGVASDVDYRYFKPKTEIREIIARAKYVLDSLIEPEPKYLGEEIPIWGEASLTDG